MRCEGIGGRGKEIGHLLCPQIDGVEEVSGNFNEGPTSIHQVDRPMVLRTTRQSIDNPDRIEARDDLDEGGREGGSDVN